MSDTATPILDPARHPYIVAALRTGARRGELLGLRWTDVDMRARTVTFPKTKNGDSRSVPMTDTLRELLSSLPRPMNAEAPVLPLAQVFDALSYYADHQTEIQRYIDRNQVPDDIVHPLAQVALQGHAVASAVLLRHNLHAACRSS